MIVAVIVFIVFLAVITVMVKVKNTKAFIAMILSLIVIPTLFVCIKKPNLHKQFSINVIYYIIKFNTDGSVTTTKQTTTTVIKEDVK